MKKNKNFKLDYSILSTYLGRFTTMLIFSAIVVLAIGAVFLEHNDMAHIPITVGVCPFDSARAGSILESLSDFALERGYGNVRWHYMDSDDLSGCDFYLLTSVQYVPYLGNDDYRCSLIATNRAGHVYSGGVILAKNGGIKSPGQIESCIFTSPFSASGFISPYYALIDSCPGVTEALQVEFSGDCLDEQRVVYSVILENMDACGLSMDSYEYLRERKVIRDDELEILLKGKAYPDLLLVSDPSVEDMLIDRFTKSFPEAIRIADRSLKERLQWLGLSGFIYPRRSDLELLERLKQKGLPAIEEYISK